MDVKNVLTDLLGSTEEEIIGIRPGEKLYETLINKEEIRYSWELDDIYIIINPIIDKEKILKLYPGIKKAKHIEEYSSDKVQKIPHDHLKKIILESKLLEK